jgi:hypothetical protein
VGSKRLNSGVFTYVWSPGIQPQHGQKPDNFYSYSTKKHIHSVIPEGWGRRITNVRPAWTTQCNCLKKKKKPARLCWFTIVILAAPKAEIRTIIVESQLGQIIQNPHLKKNPTQKQGWKRSSSGTAPALGSVKFEYQYHKKERKGKKKKKRKLKNKQRNQKKHRFSHLKHTCHLTSVSCSLSDHHLTNNEQAKWVNFRENFQIFKEERVHRLYDNNVGKLLES